MARTDLAGPELTEPLARAAYRPCTSGSCRCRTSWPVYPTHGAGSFCAAPAGDERTTTIGAERRHNRLLAAPDEDAFVAELLASFGSYPRTSCGCGSATGSAPSCSAADWRVLPLLSTDQVRQHLAGGGLVVDARPITAFAAGHIPGRCRSRCGRRSPAGWAGSSTTPGRWCSCWTRTRTARSWPASAAPSATTTWRVSWPAAWPRAAASLPQAQLPWSRPTARRRAGVVLDVRQASEVADGHLPGAVAVELGALAGDRQSGSFRRGRSR